MWLFHTHGRLRTSSHFLCWFLFGTNCVGGESDRSATQKPGLWPAVECWGCLPRLSEWPAHLWGRLGSGCREERGTDQISQLWSGEWATMKTLLIKGLRTIRKATVTLQGEPEHLWPGGERTPGSEWALLFLLLLTTRNIWNNGNQQFISQIGLTQLFSKLTCVRITGGNFWKYRYLGFSRKDCNS